MTLTVRDVSGRTVCRLQRSYEEGYQEIILHHLDLAAGLLYYTIEAGNFRATRKMIAAQTTDSAKGMPCGISADNPELAFFNPSAIPPPPAFCSPPNGSPPVHP